MPRRPKPFARRREVEARAVVLDEHRQLAATLSNLEPRARRAGVLGDVGKRLLHHAEHRRLQLEAVLDAGARGAERDLAIDAHAVQARAAIGKPLERRAEPERVERRRPQVRDDAVQVVDLAAEVPERLAHDALETRGVAAVHRGREQYAQPSEPLERRVVEVAGPSAPLVLAGHDPLPEPVLLDRLRVADGGGGARRERRGQALVGGREGAIAREPVERDEHPVAAAAEDERHDERGPGRGVKRVEDARAERLGPRAGPGRHGHARHRPRARSRRSSPRAARGRSPRSGRARRRGSCHR